METAIRQTTCKLSERGPPLSASLFFHFWPFRFCFDEKAFPYRYTPLGDRFEIAVASLENNTITLIHASAHTFQTATLSVLRVEATGIDKSSCFLGDV